MLTRKLVIHKAHEPQPVGFVDLFRTNEVNIMRFFALPKRPDHVGRVTLTRKRGWRLKEASQQLNGKPVVKVSRPSEFGNPFYVTERFTLDQVRLAYRTHMKKAVDRNPRFLVPLANRNLACWCSAGADYCHAEDLLAWSNLRMFDYGDAFACAYSADDADEMMAEVGVAVHASPRKIAPGEFVTIPEYEGPHLQIATFFGADLKVRAASLVVENGRGVYYDEGAAS